MDRVIAEIFGNKECFTPSDLKFCVSVIFGRTPSDLEVDLMFGDNLEVSKEMFRNICNRFGTSKEVRAINAFRLLDVEGKGYITFRNVKAAVEAEVPFLDWKYFAKSFKELAPGGMLFFDDFKDLFFDH